MFPDPTSNHRKLAQDIVEVLAYVSRGRGFVDVEPYPDATARRVLGALAEDTTGEGDQVAGLFELLDGVNERVGEVTNVVTGRHRGLSTTGDITGGLVVNHSDRADGGGVQIGGRTVPGTAGQGFTIQAGGVSGKVVVNGREVDEEGYRG